jgi:hypothetical protein
MKNDIVTRLRATETVGTPLMPWHVTPNEAADEIERLRKLAHNLYEETKRCGSLHDTAATVDYEEWLEEND